MKKHKYNIFPEMNKGEFDMLVRDIQLNGFDHSQPIYLYEGDILDGWNRFRACNELKIRPVYANFEGGDLEAISFVMRTNKRRNLTSSQWAVIAIKSGEIIETIKKEVALQKSNKMTEVLFGNTNAEKRDVQKVEQLVSDKVVYEGSQTPKESSKRTIEIVAELFNTNKQYIADATLIKELKPDALVDIEEGRKTIKDVKREIKLEQSKQAAIKQVDFGTENKVENIDAVSFLKSLPDESVSLCLTDPPFGIDYIDTRDVGRQTFNDGEVETLELLEAVCQELKRVLKPNSHLYFFSGYTHLQKFKDIIGKHFWLQDNPLIWVKNNHTMADFSKQYANKYEFILFAKKGTDRLLNNKISTDILEYAKPVNKIHSCEKPIDLLQYLIQNSSVEGEVVVDPFGGSLSTYRAATQIDRKCFTCELDESIFKDAVNNL